MKWIFLLQPHRPLTPAAFAAQLRANRGVTVLVSAPNPPRISVVPVSSKPLAMVSVADDRSVMESVRTTLAAIPGALSGYEVDESIPRERGARRSAVTLLTLFRKHPRLDSARFFREWYGRHTPMSLEIHPLTGYVRNAVTRTIIDGSTSWDGIVTEDFASREDLFWPTRMFGGPLRMVPNMLRVGLHVASFLDLRTLESYLMNEVVAGSPAR
jgi:hypothetical protein